MSPREREDLARRIISVLKGYSPDVEQSAHDAGLFWLNASGMHRLYRSLAKWAGSVELAVQRQGLVCSVAVGFTRFGTYAAAKVKRAITLFESEDQERAAALRAPVGVLPLGHEVLARLHQLGLTTIRDFCRFSPGALRRRFGREVEEAQRFACGREQMPVAAAEESTPLRREIRLLYPEGNREAIAHHLSAMVRELASQAFSAQSLLCSLTFELCPERWPGRDEPCMSEHIQTTRPTIDEERLARLVKLRLESLELAEPVVRISCAAEAVETDREQSELFSFSRTPELRKAEAAIAEIAAELGPGSVSVARLENSHLPEYTFTWQPVGPLHPARPSSRAQTPPLVRRMLAEPIALSRAPTVLAHGAGAAVCAAASAGDQEGSLRGGPYELSGGWWDEPYAREYYYLTDQSGRLLWIYYDRPAERWMVQGIVE